MTTESEDAPDKFEFYAVVLLGLAAVGAALAGFEANQWGSKQLEAYGDANRITTQASAQYNEDVIEVNSDYAAISQAKQHIMEARDAGSAGDKERHFEVADYIYTTMLSEKAYQAMNLPMQYYVEDDSKPAARPVSAAPAPEDAEAEDAPAAAGASGDIPDATLLATLDEELDEDYVDAMVARGEAKFKEADARFEDGGKADNIGDMYDLAGISYAVALFLGGMAMVFKTRTRWLMLGVTAVIFVASSLFIAMQPWTM